MKEHKEEFNNTTHVLYSHNWNLNALKKQKNTQTQPLFVVCMAFK